MNKALNIIKEAQRKGVKLELDEGSLVLKSTNETIDDALIADIKLNKELIIEHLEKFDLAGSSFSRIDKDAIQPADRTHLEKIPLSYNQESLWFIDQLQGSLEYHLPFAFRLSGDLNREALSSSLYQVVSRHEVLRTVIYAEDGVGYQKVLSAEDWELVNKDLSDDASSLTKDLKSFLSAPFDLGADYMFRSCLYDLGGKEYVLAGVFHHIASDAWSRGILIREFMGLYGAHVSGMGISPPPLPLQYIDYAIWQRGHLDGDMIENQLAYWEDKLKGFSELQLSTDYARPAVQSVSGASISFQLNRTVSAGIKSLSQREGTTIFMTLLAAFKVLLSRYSGQEDICVGTSVANRTQKELEGMIGYFVNTLALRTHVIGTDSFREVVQAVKQTTLEAYDHQQVPLEKVVDRVVETRDQQANPLFQVLFVVQNTSKSGEESFELDGLTLSHYGEQIKDTANFDLKMTVYESENDFSVNLNYATDLFKEETIQRMIGHFQELLKGMVQAPSEPLSELSMLTEEETQQLVEAFNETGSSLLEKEETVVHLFEEQAVKTPEATAVVYEGNALTYQELDQRSNQLARHLIDKGIQPDTLVGICIDRSVEMLVGIWGILKSGGAYVPIDPEYPQDRKAYMLEDSGVSILLSDHNNGAGFSDKENVEVIDLDGDWDAISGESSESLQSVSSPSNLAYVIYTSGSTGKPKGVKISHHNLADYFHGIIAKTNLTVCKSFGLSSSIATDLGNTMLYPSLLTGATLYVLSEDELISAEKMSALDIDCLKMVPSHWKTLQTKDAVFVPNKCLILGGEAFTNDVLEILASNQVECEVYNHYGPTETTIGKLIHKVSLTENPDHAVPLGTPFGNNRVYVLDAAGQLCPVGVTGELCIGGDGVAVGYLNQEELTKEKFIADPFKEGARIYQTGDLARWLPNGKIEFLGRKDNQIKIRGYRIELGEIENVLASVSGITQSCVLAREDEHGDKRLIGYVVMEAELDKAAWKESLEEKLQQSLPEYMVPQLWVKLEEMPLTDNGKIDRKSLPEPDGSDLSTKAYVAPRTEAEAELVEIWQDLLGVEQVGVFDNFFELGGQSLLAIRLIARIQKLGYTVNIKDFYADPSIALLSTKLSAVEEGYQVPKNGIILGCTYITPAMVTLADLSQEELERIMDQVPGGAANIQDIYPLSPLQEGIYFHHLMSDEEHGDPYLYANLLSFSSPELRSEFIKGLRFVIDRHDVFRTCILSTGFSQAIQVVLREVDLPLAELPIAADQEVLPQVEQEIASENLYIDLATAPMLRVKVADDPANETYYLVLNYHHTIMDHVGTAKIREEIALYLSGRSGLLPEPALYRDFIGHTLNKEKLARSEQYFSELYAGIEAPTYPFNLSDTMVDGATPMATSQKMLSSDVRDAIRQVSGDLQMSPAVLFHAAFGLMIGRCSNSEYALFGSVLLGRLQGAKGSDASLGLFMNGLPLLLDLHGDVAAYISQTNERLRALLDHEQTPLSKVHQWSGVANDVPLFSALLNYRHSTQRSSAGDAEQADGSGNKVVSRIQRTNYPFNFDIDDYGDDFRLTATLSNVGIDPSQVLSYMEASLKTILEHADKGSERTVSELSIIPEEEANQVWTRFNDTAAGYPADQTVVDLFREQVKKTPGEVAVVYEQESLSYKELDERSNQLAHYLVSKGVSTDVLVGICVGRGLEMVVGVLGILKSGGAYVPIDSEYPEARIDYLLEDSGVKMVLSSGEHAAAFSRSDRPEVILLDGDWDKISQEPTEQLKSMASPEHLAYVIYTSGSTGQPKGVMNSHEGIVNQLLWTQETYQLSSEDALLQKANFSFDVSVWELLWPLISGARLVLARPGGQGDVAYLKELMESQQVTTIHFVPSMLAAFLTGLAAGDCRTLRRVLCSGEALTGEQVRKFRKLFPEVRFDNLYGPTEAAVHVSSWSVPKDASSLTTVPIGLPVANTSFYILDTSERLVPTGVVGELYIGGDQVARGYLNNESLTKEQFVAHPSNAGDRLYKTGDLAWQLPDGTIEFVGRKDTQVKVRGYRIELGEIENVLASVSGITQSCVLAREDGYVDKRLIGYVVMEGALDKEFLQDQLQQKLPEYMVPRWWVALEEMPLTVNGKLDRKALPDLDHSALLTKGYAAPGTELEMALTEIWQDLLGIEKVGIYDNFFELGGHSLLIVHLISSINKRLNAEVPFAFVFKYPTISEFAAHVTADGLSGHETMISLRESGDQKPIFLAPEISGTANSYFELARSLGDNQPVYAFQCPGLDGKSNVSASIEEMAAAFIAEMQKTDPQGPYRLGGYSFGASIALEMALQLRQKGFEVDELLIFDGKIRTSLAPEVKDEDEDFALFLKDLIENYGNAYGWTDLAIEGKSIGAQIDEMHKQVKDTLSKTALKGRLGVVFNNYKLLSSYRPEMEEKLAVQVTLFKAIYRKKGADGAQVVRENSESDYGWNKYTTTEVMVHTLPAEHATILNKAYAEEITGRLNEQKEMSV